LRYLIARLLIFSFFFLQNLQGLHDLAYSIGVSCEPCGRAWRGTIRMGTKSRSRHGRASIEQSDIRSPESWFRQRHAAEKSSWRQHLCGRGYHWSESHRRDQTDFWTA